MKKKKDALVASFNVQTLKKVKKFPELITSAEATKPDIICLQEHRFLHEEKEQIFGSCRVIICSALKNSVNAVNGGIGMLLKSTMHLEILK